MHVHALPILAAALAFASTSEAKLHDRGNGLIFDDVLDITWLQDANLPATETFDLPPDAGYFGSSGAVVLDYALTWIDAMNRHSYKGFSNWRLPTVRPAAGGDFSIPGGYDPETDLAYQIGATNNELAYMYYVNLGLIGHYSQPGSTGPSLPASPGGAVVGVDGITIYNLQTLPYWTSTKVNWDINFLPQPIAVLGGNAVVSNWLYYRAWAVRDGDVTTIPEPGQLSLLIAGCALLAGKLRRRVR